ncbi:50S ribosomal protein L24 [bacterium]|nr:MAG: 50S ribosomal protein L24 [bacterium]
MKIKKGDIVEVVTGNYRGARGKVLKVYQKEKKLIVEGINFIKRHTRPTQQDPQGGIQEREAPIHISNVMLVCPNCGQPSRVGFHFMEDGTKIRICKRCREMIEA